MPGTEVKQLLDALREFQEDHEMTPEEAAALDAAASRPAATIPARPLVQMHQEINVDPAAGVGKFLYTSGRKAGLTSCHRLEQLRCWEESGLCRQVSYDTWEQIDVGLQRDLLQECMIRFANNLANDLARRAKDILVGHPTVIHHNIYELCMEYADEEIRRPK